MEIHLAFPDFTHKVTQMQWVNGPDMILSGHAGGRGIIMKVGLDGNVVWQRHHSPNPVEETPGVYQYTRILHTLRTLDGGFLCTGEYYSDPSIFEPDFIQTAFALKLDQHGCLEEGCEPNSLEELSVEELKLKLYPVPAQDYLMVQYPHDELGQVADIRIYDMLGRLRSSTSFLSDRDALRVPLNLEAGMYLLSVHCDEQLR